MAKKEKKKPGAKGKIAVWLERTPDPFVVIRGWARNGLSDIEIMENIGVKKTCFYDYLREGEFKEEFKSALYEGRRPLDELVVSKLFKKTQGYKEVEYEKVTEEIVEGPDGSQKKQIRKETVTRVYPPDTTSIIFWLKNRSKTRNDWKDFHRSEAELKQIELNNKLKELEIAEKEGRTSQSLEESGLKETIDSLVKTIKDSWEGADGEGGEK